MDAFDFEPTTRIVFGADRLDSLGQLAADLGAHRALVVSDPGIIDAGHTPRGVESLIAAGLRTYVFDGVHENPTTRDVENGLIFAQTVQPDLIVGLGGGSSMDCAKGINFLLSGGGRMQDYWGVGKAPLSMLPMIAVPTTAGTGSETQSFALISDAQTHVKMACGDKKAAFRIALLDPTLTLTQPPAVTALTGIDAISHAVETFVTTRRNTASQAFSREAWRRLAPAFRRVLKNPNDLAARCDMQLGACFAGLAIENSMLGHAHALANPLTASYHISHGQAIAVMLPHIVRFNGEPFEHDYHELLDVTEAADGCPSPERGAAGLAEYLVELAHQAGLAVRLSDLNVPDDDLPRLAAEAARQWTAQFNPRTVDEESLLVMYQAAY